MSAPSDTVDKVGHKTTLAPAALGGGSFRRRLRNLEPINMLWIVLFLFLLVLVVGPIGYLVKVSFQEVGGGAFTFANYLTAYGRSRFVQGLINSRWIPC